MRKISTSFECGFSSIGYSRSPFSMRFFFLMLIFILFDVELTLLLQLPMWGLSKNFLFWLGLSGFLLILVLITFEEWRRGLFSCKK